MSVSLEEFDCQIDKLLLELSNTESKVQSADGEAVEYRPVEKIYKALSLVRLEKEKAFPSKAKGRNRSFRTLTRRGL